MNGIDRYRQMDAARVRAELTVEELWLRYLALGGSGDAFELDGYLQGLMPLDAFQQDIVAQALNEELEERYRAFRVPLSSLGPGGEDEERLRSIVEQLLRARSPRPGPDPEPPGHRPS